MSQLPKPAFGDGGMFTLLHDHMQRDWHPVPLNLPDLEKALGGFNSYRGIGLGNHVVLAGGSSSGKTEFALWMLKCAYRMGLKSCIISYEMTPAQLRLRMAKGLFASIDEREFVPHRIDPERAKQLYAEYQEMENVFDPEIMRMRDSSLFTLLETIQTLREYGYAWIVLDNLQKIRVPDVRTTDYAARMEETCFMLRDEVETERGGLDFTLVSLSQINRTASSNRYETPTKYDMLGGTAIESSANQVLMLDHTRQYYDAQGRTSRNWVILDKNTDGPSGLEIPFAYSWQHRQMRQGMPDELDRDPALGGWPQTPKGERR